MRILLVDDDSFALKLVSHQLQRLGHPDVHAFAEPELALARLQKDIGEFELILLDLQMPGIDGIEFVRHLAKLKFRGGVALISAEDDRVLQAAYRLAAAHQLEVRGALHKPITPGQLEVLLGSVQGHAGAPRRASKKIYSPDRVARAIADREFVNFYQPQVSLKDGRLEGVETLVRWQHPDDGLVFPDQFIGIAEEHRLIDDLTRLILDSAIAQAGVWEREGLGLHVSVNISMDNLADLDFPDWVTRELNAAGTSARTLMLEVTESRLMTNVVAALDILARLQLKHVNLSIDDFGTGHSSLAQLRDLPFGELKIDRGFIDGMSERPTNRAIVEGSLAMAHQLSMRTVAEGVEQRADWELLRTMGCDMAQGYLVAKPMRAEQLPEWMAAWERRVPELIGG